MSTIAKAGYQIDMIHIYLVRSNDSLGIIISCTTLLLGPDNSARLYKFKSPADFAPHALWIYRNQADLQCSCRLCDGTRRQTLRQLSNPGPRESSILGANVKAFSFQPTETINKDAAPASNIYREGEIVWLGLIPQATEIELLVKYWPGEIVALETEIGRDGNDQNIRIFQKYSVRLLATKITERVYDWDLIPYLGFSPFAELDRLALKYASIEESKLQAIMDKWKDGTAPLEAYFPLTNNKNYMMLEDVMPSYLAAVQASANIALSYGLEFPCIEQSSVMHETQSKGRRSYDGIWWGPERVRIFDLVRLKAERCQFPEEMQSSFLRNLEPVGGSGIFMHISAIYEMESDGGFPLISGVLYEVVTDPLIAIDGTNARKGNLQLPLPPPHCTWKAVLDSNSCATVLASLIAGRYYPETLRHPRMRADTPSLDHQNADNADSSSRALAISSLAGLEAGWRCQTSGSCRYDVRGDAVQQASVIADKNVQDWMKGLLQKIENPNACLLGKQPM